MKMQKLPVAVFLLLFLLPLLASCGRPATGTPTTDINVQIQTAIAQTEQAKTAIDQAVQQTVTAKESTTSAGGAGEPSTPTPMPTVDPSTLTEEELAALIEEAVNEAYLSAEESSTTTSSAVDDGTVTEEELYTATYSYYVTEANIEYAESLIASYTEYYGEYAETALETLNAIEQDLSAISQSVEEMSNIVEQGAETAQNASEQLKNKASEVQEKLGQAKERPAQLQPQVQTGIAEREEKFMNMAPTQVADNRDGAVLQVFDYLEAFKSALGDGKISPTEMTDIAQRAANARASIDKHGGPGMKNITDSMDRLTRNASRGEWSHASKNLDGFERSLPEKPKRRP